MAVSAVARAIVGNKIGNAAQRHRRFEAIRMAHNPVGHEAAIASAGDAHAVGVYPRISLQRRADTVHDVLIVLAAPLIDDAPFELLAVASRAARVREEHGIT